MAQPYDFSLANQVAPVGTQDFQMGLQTGQVLKQGMLNTQMNNDALEQQKLQRAAAAADAQAKAERAASFQKRMLAEVDRPTGPVAANLHKLALEFPEYADNLSKSASQFGAVEKEQMVDILQSTAVRARNGDVVGAAAGLEEKAQAYENTPGREAQAESLRTVSSLCDPRRRLRKDDDAGADRRRDACEGRSRR